jgi:hypothetical protein
MKTLLLITGLMPAFDNQVRKGLENAGFKGVKKTQYLLPENGSSNADVKKITRLPFILGNCWREYRSVLSKGIQQSRHPNLDREPGRLFDILFFTQENPEKKNLLFDSSGNRLWYDIN